MHSPRKIIFICVTALLIAAGCKGGRSYQVASPVLGPVPPRVAQADSGDDGTGKASTKKSVRGQNHDIENVSFDNVSKQPLSMTDVVAEVNGEPILAHEIFDQRYSVELNKRKHTMKPEQLRQIQMEIIAKELPLRIDQTLMVDAIKSNLKTEQMKGIDDQMDKYFQGEIDRLMKATNTGSPTELETVLQANGTSLVTMRKNFGDNQLARQYLRTKIGEDPKASREEMQLYFEEHREKYTESEEIKWQQIDISYAQNGGVDKAEAVAQALLDEIREGTISFDEAAHKRSDSPLASSGGHSDWTKPKSLADKDLRHTLTLLEMNEVSELIPTKKAFLIVMLTGHHEARVIPFGEVQKEIHDLIVKEKRDKLAKEVVSKLRETAVIHTILDAEADNNAGGVKEKLLIQ